jgi:hypothetical protein
VAVWSLCASAKVWSLCVRAQRAIVGVGVGGVGAANSQISWLAPTAARRTTQFSAD